MVKVSGRKFIPAQDSSAEVTRGLSTEPQPIQTWGQSFPLGIPRHTPLRQWCPSVTPWGWLMVLIPNPHRWPGWDGLPPAGVGVAEGQGAALSHGQLRDAATAVVAAGSHTPLTQRDPMRGTRLGAACDFHALPLPLEGGLTAFQVMQLCKQKHSLGSFINFLSRRICLHPTCG